MSPCGSDHIFTSLARGAGVWPLRIPGVGLPVSRPFLLIVRTGRIFTARADFAVAPDSTGFPAYGQLQIAGSLPRWAGSRRLPRAPTLGPFVHCYFRQSTVGGAVISAALCTSPCRPDYPITTRASRVWRLVSEDSRMPRGSHRPYSGGCRRRSYPTGFEGSLRLCPDPSTALRPAEARAA